MKKVIQFPKTIALLSVVLISFSCSKDPKLGPVTDKTETYSDIHTVILNVPGTVTIVPDSSFSVKVQSHEEIVNAISITNTLGQLTISIVQPEDGLKYDIFNVTIKSKLIREVTNNSSADVSVGDVMNYTSSKINQNSTGAITVSSISSNLTEVNLAGTGNLTLSGNTENATLKVIGTGNIKA